MGLSAEKIYGKCTKFPEFSIDLSALEEKQTLRSSSKFKCPRLGAGSQSRHSMGLLCHEGSETGSSCLPELCLPPAAQGGTYHRGTYFTVLDSQKQPHCAPLLTTVDRNCRRWGLVQKESPASRGQTSSTRSERAQSGEYVAVFRRTPR
ncbi:hypothetical protein MMC29_004818 [Sticta canariensis]|nr:hypothetical protein [Sticta canariensis]